MITPKQLTEKITEATGLTFRPSITSNSFYCNERSIRVSDHYSKYTERKELVWGDKEAIDLVNVDFEYAMKLINQNAFFSALVPGVTIRHIHNAVGPIEYISHNQDKGYVEVFKINEKRIVKYDFEKIALL